MVRRALAEVCTVPVLLMAALCNRAGHYIFALWFLSSIFYLLSSFFFTARAMLALQALY